MVIGVGRRDVFCSPSVWSQSFSEHLLLAYDLHKGISALPTHFDETGRLESSISLPQAERKDLEQSGAFPFPRIVRL